MEREATVYQEHAAADQADRAYYRSLTPQQRLDLTLELIGRYQEARGEAEQRLARVCRVVELGRR